ncbi:Outer membrane protein transport protein (OMPP1/FadL/TodX) [Shimia sp. SK013]|uniref:OmpP1/FadL family transporter n=1 Tax=Shimia sp. SK013 TaxID=1389006 RepID=UPI0006B4C1C2|nr:hypothetical protein [Shimia sp. SK013]KPA22680.1 Outer membrane protein transport protein (OMPP1/FadL/TodX) [Shimia sp. SK013]
MKHTIFGFTALSISAGSAFAGGLDRSGQGINLIFEEGTVAQFSYGFVSPSVSGTLGGAPSGNVGVGHGITGFGYKQSINDRLDVAIIYDQPFGAKVDYSPDYPLSGGPGSPDNLRAQATTETLTALMRARLENGFSVYGGLRGQGASANLDVPAAGYSMTSSTAYDLGYLVGAAWERPDIAARVALTYNSSIDHTVRMDENGSIGSHYSDFKTPHSLNLEFQTGVASNTMVFGSVRWVDWSQLSIESPNYPGNVILAYEDDTITYTLGVGQRFSDKFSGAISVGFEDSVPGAVSDLGPTNGSVSLGIGGTYSRNNAEITFGVRHVWLGDATTDSGAVFTDNSAWAAAINLTYHFD